MTSRSPIFPIPEPQHYSDYGFDPQHYSDYGFDPQIDYLQVLEEARKHICREAKSPDALHCKLQKPISKDDQARRSSKNKKRSRWWRNALLFFKPKRADCSGGEHAGTHTAAAAAAVYSSGSHPSSPYAHRAGTGPLYLTESGDGHSWTPCRRSAAGGWRSRPSSGPLRLSEMGEADVPYLCLRDPSAMDASPVTVSAVPIYLVT